MSEWKIVPVEPTPEMVARVRAMGGQSAVDRVLTYWDTMLNEAPTPPAEVEASRRVHHGALMDLTTGKVTPPAEPPADADALGLIKMGHADLAILAQRLQRENARLAAERDQAREEVAKQIKAYADMATELTKGIVDAKAERDALRGALKAVVPYVATKAVGCHGDKCRESWCHSCNSDEDAAAAAQRGRDACHAANAALARAKENKNE